MIQKIKLWLIIPLVTMLVSVGLIVLIRPVLGIDFTGGSLLEIEAKGVAPENVGTALEQELDLPSTVQSGEGNRLLIRTTALPESQHQEVLRILREKDILTEELRFESIGPTIGAELRRKTVMAVAVALVILVVYLTYTFRKAGGLISPWKFGVAAIYALVHDLLFVTAMFVILGAWLGVSIDTLFVTAMLVVLGYSVNDTIIIFDRIREHLAKNERENTKEPFEQTVGKSISETLTRSINTSLTVVLALFVLVLLGAPATRDFALVMLVGVVAGTYSSILLAAPLLIPLSRWFVKK